MAPRGNALKSRGPGLPAVGRIGAAILYVAAFGLPAQLAAQGWNVDLVGRYGSNGCSRGIFADSGMVFTAEPLKGLVIVDATQPGSPTLLAQVAHSSPQDLCVMDGLAYTAELNGFRIHDVTRPSSPTLLGSLTTSHPAVRIGVSGSLVCLQTIEYGNLLQIVDVSNPAAPIPRGAFRNPGHASSLFVEGKTAYVTWNDFLTTSAGLHILDISNPGSPRRLGSFHTPFGVQDVWAAGDLAYVTWRNLVAGRGGLYIVDCRRPESPILRSFYEGMGAALEVCVENSYAYVTDYYRGVKILDVTIPETPKPAGSFAISDHANGVSVSDGLIYVTDPESGLWILRHSPPTLSRPRWQDYR